MSLWTQFGIVRVFGEAWLRLKTDVWVKQRRRNCSLCVVPAVLWCGWHFLSARWALTFLLTQVLAVADFQNCLNVLDLFREVPAQHKLPTSNCGSQWPITSIADYLHNASPIMHAGVIVACTTAVSDCRCSSRAVLTCAWTAQTSGHEQPSHQHHRAAPEPGNSGFVCAGKILPRGSHPGIACVLHETWTSSCWGSPSCLWQWGGRWEHLDGFV